MNHFIHLVNEQMNLICSSLRMNLKSSYTNTSPFDINAVILESDRLRLEPLTEHHIPNLLTLFDSQIWNWYTHRINSPVALKSFLEHILEEQTFKRTLAFAIFNKVAQKWVDSSRFMNLHSAHRRLEIGSTWYAPQFQRSFVNTDSKLLMLTHAFEELNCISVQFQTDVLNEKARVAIERLGAKQECILRNDRICEDGRIRHSVYYSITSEEWGSSKAALLEKLARNPLSILQDNITSLKSGRNPRKN